MSLPQSENDVEGTIADKKAQRLFFALWPDEVLRQNITDHCLSLLQQHEGRLVDPTNYHITLAFLGNVDTSQQTCVEQAAARIQNSVFTFTLDIAGHWPKPRVLWIGPGVMPEALVTLATDLRDEAIACGISMDRRPYRAHVTLERKVTRTSAEMVINPIVWKADRFVLVRSTTHPEGVRYEVIKEWPLLAAR